MAIKLASLTLCMLHLTTALPTSLLSAKKANAINTLESFVDLDDTIAVSSYVRETRAAPANDGGYYKSDEREGNGEIGYSRKKSGGGKKGYQHFDSYHKKAGDNYEFEKQDSYGLEEKGQDGAYSHRNERIVEREDERERQREPEEFEDDREHRSQKQKKRKEEQQSELREGPDNGNGGVEAVGHDPNDYILPEKYTYGKEEEEYDF